MGKRIGNLINCINPAHSDNNPSMAVYATGSGKLQVYCFSCKYHAYVLPDKIDISSNKQEGKRTQHTELLQREQVTGVVTQFFTKRNISPVPWANIRYGLDVIPIPNKDNYGYQPVNRPCMEWDLLDQHGNKQGIQRRYLDDRKPKTKYFPNSQGEYAKEAWVTNTNNKTLAICESWVDAQWVHQRYPGIDVLTILGTSTKYICNHLYVICSPYTEVDLYFDGDTPGIKAVTRLITQLGTLGTMWYNGTTKGKKVYEL